MKAHPAFALVVLGASFAGACGEPHGGKSAARLERELRQAKALESLALSAPLETRTGEFDEAIASVEARSKAEQPKGQETRP